jgi:hypothetical protein
MILIISFAKNAIFSAHFALLKVIIALFVKAIELIFHFAYALLPLLMIIKVKIVW